MIGRLRDPLQGLARGAFATLLSTLLLLALLEGLARIAYTVYRDVAAADGRRLDDDWATFSADVGWELRPGYRGKVGGTQREIDSRGYLSVDSAQIEDATKPRVLFLGDSNTFGWQVPAESTFVELLDRILPEANAINLGVPGYTSYQGYRTLLRRGPEVRPDILVVSFNFNDRRYVLSDDDVDGPRFFDRVHRRRAGVSRVLESAYLYRGLLSLARRSGLRAAPTPVELDALRPRVSSEDYGRNLAAIVEWARSRDVDVVFLVLKDNPIHTEYLRTGVELLESQRYDAASDALEVAVAKGNWFSDLAAIHLARAYRAQGRADGARGVVRKVPYVSLHGGSVIRLDSEYNDVLRRVGMTYGIEIVDAAALLDQTPSDYLDFCHPDVNGHRRIAWLLSGALAPRVERLLRGRSPEMAGP